MVEFEKPAGLTAETVSTILWGSTLIDDTITAPLGHFTSFANTQGDTIIIQSFICYGDERKMQTGLVNGPGGSTFEVPDNFRFMVIPFSPVAISEGASSVTLNISWDLNGIIEQWTGDDNTANNNNDKFVFKKGWWNNLHVTASVQ